MKIVILQGGHGCRRRRAQPADTANANGPGAAVTARAANPSTSLPTGTCTSERGAMAIGDGSGHWVLINLTPAVAEQLGSDPGLQAHLGLADAQVRAVLLTDAQIDHVGGLLSLRHGAPIDLYATPAVFEDLTAVMPVLPVLQHYCGAHWRVVPVAGDHHEASFQIDGMPDLSFTAIATRAPPPPHLCGRHGDSVGGSIAVAVHDRRTGQRAFCAPGLAQFGLPEVEWMRGADGLFVDGPTGLCDRPWIGSAGRPGPGRNAGDAPPWLAQVSALPARIKVLMASEAGANAAGDLWRPPEGMALAYDGMAIDL